MVRAFPFYITLEREDPWVRGIVEQALGFFESVGDLEIPRKHVTDNSLNKYVKQSFNPKRGQISFVSLLSLFREEPRQKEERHYKLAILETDLYFSNDNYFLFGCTESKISKKGEMRPDVFRTSDGTETPLVRGVVISLNRLKGYYDEYWERAFYAILLHELGHFYGLSCQENPHYIEYDDPSVSPLEWGHCDNPKCMMEQVNVPKRPDLLAKTLYLEKTNPDWFCQYDLRALRRNLRALYR